jgi:hypothetical protein
MSWLAPLLSALLGGTIGVIGTLLGARTQIKEARQVRAEEYARDDKFRLHKERLEAYSEFYIAAGHGRRILIQDDPAKDDMKAVRSECWHAYTKIVLVGDDAVLEVSGEILSHVTDVAFNKLTFDREYYKSLIHRLQSATRSSLTK